MKQIGFFLLFMMIVCVSGCDDLVPKPPPPSVISEQPVDEKAVSQPQTLDSPDPAAPVAEVSAPAEEPAPKTEVREVQIGDDRRGHYEKHEFIAAPIGVYFRATQGMELERITAAINLYKAMNDNKPPATEEIFMKEVIEANRIKLPQLKEGWKYLYDPETGKLMVEKPVEE